jgi:hypothetical protein
MVQCVPFFGRFGQRGDAVLLVCPRAKVYQLAAFAAKGAKFVFRLPYNRGVAGGAGYGGHGFAGVLKRANYSFSGCLWRIASHRQPENGVAVCN